MSTNRNVEQQLNEYFGWLEEHVGSDMRASDARSTGNTPRVGRGLLAAAGVAGVIALIVVVVNRDNSPGRVVPASTVADAPITAPTTVVTTPPSDATTWAPVNLPDGMQVVDVTWGSELPGYSRPLATQNFARLSSDGVSHEATLTLRVTRTEQGEPEISTGTVHGLPASITVLTDPPGPVVGWWVEHDLIVEFNTTGLETAEVIELLNATTWRADFTHGFEPDSIAGGMSLLDETVGTEPRPYTTFIVETEGSYVTVEARPGVARISDASLGVVPGVGQLLEENPGATVVLTDDGTAISISNCCGPKGGPSGASSEALAIAGAFAHVDDETVVSLASAAVARELALPEVGRVTVGANEVVLRGGTQTLPEALCVVVSGVEGCTINHRFPAGTTDDLRWGNEWVLAGDNWFFLMYRPTDVRYGTASICPADANGRLGEPLPYDSAIDGDRLWVVTQIPADVAFTTVCGWELDGEPIDLLPADNITAIVRRPPT